MKLIKNNKIDLDILEQVISRPDIFEKSTAKFWDDPYVSEQVLPYHLDPEVEAASKNHKTISKESQFIIEVTGMDKEKNVIDLGCGPGLYVREFAKTGACVTGVDFSKGSIEYANSQIGERDENVKYKEMNYLELDNENEFDIATLIYYDFCALDTDEQRILLSNIHKALKTKGYFVFDVFTKNRKVLPATRISVFQSGLWSPEPYVEILNTCVYEEPLTEGLQYTIIDEQGALKVIRIYHRLFDFEELKSLLENCGFEVERVYRNLQGDPLSDSDETFGIVAQKRECHCTV